MFLYLAHIKLDVYKFSQELSLECYGITKKFPLEIACGSIIEIDSAIGIAFKLEYTLMEELKPLGESIVKTFKLLSGMIKRDDTHN